MRPAGMKVKSVSGCSFVIMRLSHGAVNFASDYLRGFVAIGI